MARTESASLSTLCLACGMCCDGNLFTQVPLVADEPVRLRARGLLVIARERELLNGTA